MKLNCLTNKKKNYNQIDLLIKNLQEIIIFEFLLLKFALLTIKFSKYEEKLHFFIIDCN